MAELTPERLSAVRYSDMDGNMIPLLEWGAQFEDFDARRVAESQIAGQPGILLVTALLGLRDPAHGLYPFGTAIRTGTGTREIAQYDTKVQAQEGHAEFLDWLTDNDAGTYTDEIRRRLVPDSHPPQ